MAGKRRQETRGALHEAVGIALLFSGFALFSFALYALGGLWAGIIPSALALVWIGYNMGSGSPPPHAVPGDPRTGTRPVLPEYRDPDAGLYERDSVPVDRESERD